MLVISGRVSLTTTQSGQLEPLFRTTGTELGKYGFDPYVEVDASEIYTPTIALFALSVPYPAGLNRVGLTNRYGRLLSSRVASAHPPTVTVKFQNAVGATLDGVQTIRGSGNDPDNVGGGAAGATTTVVVQLPPPPPELFYTFLPLVIR